MLTITEKDGDLWLVHSITPGDRIPSLEYHPIPAKMSGPFERMLPDTVVIHYTAGPSTESALSTWEDPEVKASAHFIIERDGRITQCVPINRIAWHAGRSQWRAWTGEMRTGLNRYSLGIELVNPGPLDEDAEKQLRTWWKGTWLRAAAVQYDSRWWASYPLPQLDALKGLVLGLADLLPEALPDTQLQEVIRHSDIAPGRKEDPGPLLDLTLLRAYITQGDVLEQPERRPGEPVQDVNRSDGVGTGREMRSPTRGQHRPGSGDSTGLAVMLGRFIRAVASRLRGKDGQA